VSLVTQSKTTVGAKPTVVQRFVRKRSLPAKKRRIRQLLWTAKNARKVSIFRAFFALQAGLKVL
jgi:hypothetical protein